MHYVARLCLLLAGSAVFTSCIAKMGNNVPAEHKAVLDDVMYDVDFVKHEQGNVNIELRSLEGKLSTQESLLSTTRRELLDAQTSNRQLVSGKITGFDSRLASLEAVQEGLLNDMRQLKTHSNDVASSLTQSKQKITEFEKLIEGQTRNIRNLEGAVRALMALVKGESQQKSHSIAAASAAGKGNYQVQPGDTLEKIARHHNMSVDKLKQLNGLTSDLIKVGQKLATEPQAASGK